MRRGSKLDELGRPAVASRRVGRYLFARVRRARKQLCQRYLLSPELCLNVQNGHLFPLQCEILNVANAMPSLGLIRLCLPTDGPCINLESQCKTRLVTRQFALRCKTAFRSKYKLVRHASGDTTHGRTKSMKKSMNKACRDKMESSSVSSGEETAVSIARHKRMRRNSPNSMLVRSGRLDNLKSSHNCFLQ